MINNQLGLFISIINSLSPAPPAVHYTMDAFQMFTRPVLWVFLTLIRQAVKMPEVERKELGVEEERWGEQGMSAHFQGLR